MCNSAISEKKARSGCQRTSFSNVGDIVVLEVEHTLGVLDHGTGVGGNKVLNGLGHAILCHESARLGSANLRARRVLTVRHGEQTTVLLDWDQPET